MQVSDLVDLGYHHSIRPGGDLHIGLPPFRVEPVDPNGPDRTGDRPGCQRRLDDRARLGLLVRTDRILEIEDQHVSTQVNGFLDGAGIGGGHEQGRADETSH